MFMKLMHIVNLRLLTYSTQKIISSNGSCLYINKLGYSKFEVESSAFLSEMKSLISKFEVENGHNPIFQNFDLWLKTAIGMVS